MIFVSGLCVILGIFEKPIGHKTFKKPFQGPKTKAIKNSITG